jgi:effector-binding domain-containing protein
MIAARYIRTRGGTETGVIRWPGHHFADLPLDHLRWSRISFAEAGVIHRPRAEWENAMIRILALALLLASASAASAQQLPAAPAPTLPPPGSLVTPPAAPNPGGNPPAAQSPAAGDQNRAAEIGGPTEVALEARAVLLLRGQSTWDDGFDTLMESFRKLREEAAKRGIETAARPQAAFTSTDDFGFKFEAMIELRDGAPAAAPVLTKDFEIGRSPSGKALKFTHAGAYDDIDTTYEAITAYLDEKGLKARNLFVEEYLTDPKTSEDSELQMNILVLIE